jgi:hypothetical protein
MDDRQLIFEHPKNQGILECLQVIGQFTRGPLSCHPSEAEDPYYLLGTHPDLVEVLWDKLTVEIPVDTRWILHARPVLIHPGTKIIFAFATGTQTYALRIPAGLRPEANAEDASQQYKYADGTIFDLAECDPDWIFGGNIPDEARLCLVAFQAAGEPR